MAFRRHSISSTETINKNLIILGQPVVKYLSHLQAWPTADKNVLHFIPVFIYSNILLAGLYGHLIKYYEIHERLVYDDIAIDLALIAMCWSGYHFCIYFFIHRRLAKELLLELGDFRVYEKPHHIERHDAWMNMCCKVYVWALLAIAPVFGVYLMVQRCDAEDFTCGLVYPAYLPGMMSGVRRRIYLLLQLTGVGVYASLGLFCSWMGIQCAQYLVDYVQHLQWLLQRAAKITDWNVRRMHIRNAIIYHQRILTLYAKFFRLAKGLYMVHSVMTPMIIAMSLQTFFVRFQVQCFVLCFIWSNFLFVLCYIGQRMINANEELNTVIYFTFPNDGDLQSCKLLLIMCIQSKRMIYIPSGPISICGFELFLKIVKSTYSLLTLIQTLP